MTEQELSHKDKQELKEKEATRPGRYYVPELDIYEDDHNLWLSADMPGVDESHVEVELDDDVLTLHGKVAPEEYEGLKPLYSEYNVGHYLRRFTLVNAASFERDRITAHMSNGVLEVCLPKAEKAKLRRITVNAAS
jgi:HSP20 family protein